MAVLDSDSIYTASPHGDSSNVLLLAPSLDGDEATACGDLLTLTVPETTNVLFVSLTKSAVNRLHHWERQAHTAPANTGIITVDHWAQKPQVETTGRHPDDTVTIKTVSNPADLTQIGIAFMEFLSEWENDGNQIVVCFHSLTTLLQYVELKRAFRFLHVFTGHTQAAGAMAHFHMDRVAHDDRELNTLTTLFDTVIEAGHGDLNITRR